MTRRLLCLFCCALFLLPGLAQAGSFSQFPDRETFSLGYERLQTALYRERPVQWGVQVEPAALGAYTDGDMDVMNAMLSSIQFFGNLQCFKEGGWMDATMQSDGREIASVGQAFQDGRMGLNLSGEWLSFDQGMGTEALAMLQLDDLGQSLLQINYDSIRAGDKPFVTPIYKHGLALWGLASPYSEDSNRLSVPSGATGHGVIYEIDTAALQTMLKAWTEGLTREGLSVGIGTGLSVGISQEAFDGFLSRLRTFANTVEVTKNIRLTTTFGEADLLRTAKGSGTIANDGKRTGISYNYSCNVSSTRTTRKYKIDFQPEGMDTLVLTCTIVTSSNNSASGASEINVSASGIFAGQPYKLKYKQDLINKYAEDDAERLAELITGTITGSLQYADRLVADVTLKRNCETSSAKGLTTAVRIIDAFDTVIQNEEGVLFEGVVTLGYDVADGPQETPNLLEQAVSLEGIDFLKAESMRDSMKDALTQAKERLLETLPVSTLSALTNSH